MAFYTDTQRQWQEQFECTPLAEAIEAAIVATELNDAHRAFISSRDFFFLSTVNGRGEPTVSYKGGDVGVVRVVDDRTLAFPIYDGNGMFLSVGNMDETARIGMLFIDFETPQRVRVQAEATVHADHELLPTFPGAIAVAVAAVTEVFINCARYIHRHQRVGGTDRYVPDAEGNAPFPSWKRIDLLQDVLPPSDAGRADEHGGTITEAEYGARLMAGES